MRPLRAVLLGAAAYLVFLVATMPASLVAREAMKASAGRLTLSGASGTLWNGSAAAELVLGGSTLALDLVRWRFQPLRLFAGRIAFAVETRAEGLDARGEILRGLSAWEVREASVNGDAADFASLYSPAALWQPAGRIAITAARLAWDGKQAAGSATADWRDASVALSPVRPLGSWRMLAEAKGESAALSLESVRGPLILAGTGTLALPGGIAFAGTARAESGHETELESLLKLLGPRRADGTRAIEIR